MIMTDQERLDFDRLNSYIAEGRLIRGSWTDAADAAAAARAAAAAADRMIDAFLAAMEEAES